MTNAVSRFLQTDSKEPAARQHSHTGPFQFIDFMTPIKSQAFSYSHMYSVAFDGSIEIAFTEHAVVLAGENLESIYLALQDHAVDRVVSVDELHAKATNLRVYVTSIHIREIREDGE